MRFSSISFAIGLLGCLGLAAGCVGGDRPTGPPVPLVDSGAGDAGDDPDGGGGGPDGGGGIDAGEGTDGGGGGTDGGGGGTDGGGGGGENGTCDPACLAMSGAMCCTACGCGGAEVRCEPRCSGSYTWDCELGCCFDRSTFECDCPADTEWNPDMGCCTDAGGTCVTP